MDLIEHFEAARAKNESHLQDLLNGRFRLVQVGAGGTMIDVTGQQIERWRETIRAYEKAIAMLRERGIA